MASTPDTPNRFVLEVFDSTLWCPIAQAPFYPTDLVPLRPILGPEAADDDGAGQTIEPYLDLRCLVIEQPGIEGAERGDDPCDLVVIKEVEALNLGEAPYLVHTGWELPLMLEGRKKLAIFSDWYPSPLFDCEEAFDRWVANGALHKEVIDEPFEKPNRKWLGQRTVYYT